MSTPGYVFDQPFWSNNVCVAIATTPRTCQRDIYVHAPEHDDEDSIMSTESSPNILVIRMPPESYIAFWTDRDQFQNIIAGTCTRMTQTSCESVIGFCCTYYWINLQNVDSSLVPNSKDSWREGIDFEDNYGFPSIL
jgi:hypothetical protein